MTAKPLFLLCILACALLPGCTVCQNLKRTILDEPSDFSWMEDREQSLEVYRTWADRAWREERSSDPEQCVSKAYVVGFKDGFVDYVYAGGSGEPPPVPPRQFWNVDVRNPRGHSEAADWFAGYRHGSQLAREAGYRERALIPSSLFLFGAREDHWESEPSYVETLPDPVADPVAEPIAEPLQPEFASPPPVQPEARIEVSEPKLPTLATPTVDMPNVEVPKEEVPNVDIPAIEIEVPSVEILPQPPEAPPQSNPIELPPEDVRPPLDVDEIFDSPSPDRSAHKSQLPRPTKIGKVVRQDPAVQRARAAFASAIRNRKVKTKSSDVIRLLSYPDNGKSDNHKFEEPSSATAALPHFRRNTAAIPTRRSTTIPHSEDRAEEMFRRLSR